MLQNEGHMHEAKTLAMHAGWAGAAGSDQSRQLIMLLLLLAYA
jgi:hypothetical protein